MIHELSVPELRRTCDPKLLPDETAMELGQVGPIIGQERAVRAMQFGLDIQSWGFNIYVAGMAGTGRATAVERFVEEIAITKPTPMDWCYVYNFEDNYRPRALGLPGGRPGSSGDGGHVDNDRGRVPCSRSVAAPCLSHPPKSGRDVRSRPGCPLADQSSISPPGRRSAGASQRADHQSGDGRDAGGGGLTIGVGSYLSIQLPVSIIAGTIGVWLFYVQHQFDGVYWSRHGDWDPLRAALEGSSYYKLPRLLQWCTGSIGLHHIHHARPGVPNYNLQRCHDGVAVARAVEPLTLWKSVRSLRMNLWDERKGRLVSFRSVKTLRGQVVPQ